MNQIQDKVISTNLSRPLVFPFKHTIVKTVLSEKSLKVLDFLPDRIIDKIFFNFSTGCWEWQGWKRKGYGRCNWQGFRWSVHRLMFELIRGKIDKKLGHDHLMHLCENKCCCNPWHLKPGTNSDNQLHYHKMRKKK